MAKRVTAAGAAARRSARLVTVPWRVLPDFLVIGAMKSGTTTLFAYLAQHPDVCRPATKEIQYFSHFYDRGTTWYRAHFPLYKEFAGRHRPWLMGQASTALPERSTRSQPSRRSIAEGPADRRVEAPDRPGVLALPARAVERF
jgi:hypothetical protein